MTKQEKELRLREIEEQIEDFYTEAEATAIINEILEPWSPLCRLTFGETAFKITYSYMVKSWQDRQRICAILAHTGATSRDCENMAAEWRFHNVAHALRLRRRSARDVDIDYERDNRWYVCAAVALFDWLELE